MPGYRQQGPFLGCRVGRAVIREHVDIYRYANVLGLEIERFDQDVRVHPTKLLDPVQDDARDAELMALNSTPTSFVNDVRHKGPWDSASLIRALEATR